MTKQVNLLHNSMVDMNCHIDLATNTGCFCVVHGHKSESFYHLNDAIKHFFTITEGLFDQATKLVEECSSRHTQLVIGRHRK